MTITNQHIEVDTYTHNYTDIMADVAEKLNKMCENMTRNRNKIVHKGCDWLPKCPPNTLREPCLTQTRLAL